jgi:1-acyl-sn-glycerol-3-phosphate acyltransferase
MSLLRSLLTYCTVALYVLLIGPFGMLAAFFARRPYWLYSLGRGGLQIGLWIAGVKFIVEGREKIRSDRNYVFISNHVSNLDPPILILAIPREIRVIAKKELRKIPLIGKAMAMVGFVFVDRKRREDAQEGVDRSAGMIRQGHSFLVFPEGTRSSSGRLSTFKKGAFVLAIKGGADLLPMIIDGSYELMPRGSLAVKKGKVKVRFLDPIPASDLAYGDREKLLSEARHIMEKALSSRQA